MYSLLKTISFFSLFLINSSFSQISYNYSIQPIFNNHCLDCHQTPVRAGALELDSYEKVILGDSNNGPIILPYSPDSSLLYKVLLRDSVVVPNEPICCRMPKNSPPLSISQISLIYDWISQGAQENNLQLNERKKTKEYSFYLIKNYPNPFNPLTTLKYDLPEDSFVQITVYDMLGNVVNNLVNKNQNSGSKSVQWDATNNQGEPVSAGIYLYTIQAGEFVQTKKMVLLK
jgi:hypothetical protein